MSTNNKLENATAYWLVAWLGCCIILVSIFYLGIQHQKRVDKIFDDYYKNVPVIGDHITPHQHPQP